MPMFWAYLEYVVVKFNTRTWEIGFAAHHITELLHFVIKDFDENVGPDPE